MIMHKERELTASKAVTIGHLTVSLPAMAIMLGAGVALYILTSRILLIWDLEPSFLWLVGLILIGTIAAATPAWIELASESRTRV